MQEYRYAFGQKQEIGYRWYKPLLTMIIFVLLHLVFSALILLLAGMIYGSRNNGSLSEAIEFARLSAYGITFAEKYSVPWMMIVFGTNIAMIPALTISHKIIFGKMPGKLLSADKKWRLSVFLKYIISAAIMFTFLHMFTVSHNTQKISASASAGSIILLAAMCFLQCLAEELVFRGLILQSCSGWSEFAIFGIAVQAFYFTIAHLYEIKISMLVFTTAFIWGILCVITDGIEASFSIHYVFNMTYFLPEIMGYKILDDTDMTFERYMTCMIISVVFVTTEYVMRRLYCKKERKNICGQSEAAGF